MAAKVDSRRDDRIAAFIKAAMWTGFTPADAHQRMTVDDFKAIARELYGTEVSITCH
jgi:hypothetical protein